MPVKKPTPEQCEDAYVLFDLLLMNPQGLTRVDVQNETGWNRRKIVKTVQVLRDLLSAQNDDISVPCDPDPDDPNGPWLYSLMAGQLINDPAQTNWPSNRIDDAERRILTIKHVLDAAVKATDGRSRAGRRARIWVLHLQRAQEELAMLDGEVE